MLTTRSDQRGLWEADRLYIDHVGSDSFYGLLASLRGQLFRDEEFADRYCPDNGRGSVPPSLLATALLLRPTTAPVTARPRRVRTSISAGRWRWASRSTRGPSPRAHCRCSAPS